MQTHLFLVKLIERKRLENGGDNDTERNAKREAPDANDTWEEGDEGDFVDSPEAFLALFPE